MDNLTGEQFNANTNSSSCSLRTFVAFWIGKGVTTHNSDASRSLNYPTKWFLSTQDNLFKIRFKSIWVLRFKPLKLCGMSKRFCIITICIMSSCHITRTNLWPGWEKIIITTWKKAKNMCSVFFINPLITLMSFCSLFNLRVCLSTKILTLQIWKMVF